MPIAFEQVSYSYGDPEKEQRERERAERRRARRAGRDAGRDGKRSATPSPAAEKAKWGTPPDALWALQDVSFTLQDGEFLGLAGHTGSGKSTLIQHMNGLVRPTRGRVLFDGRDLADKQAAQDIRGKVGLVFQYPEHQLFAPTVAEDVAFGPRNLGLSPEEVDARVHEALRSVHLDPEAVGARSPFELSGGQQRRVALAGVLAMNPSVLVLDEPAAGLDPAARESLLALIEELHAGGLTVAMASHSMDDLARMADRILVLNAGRQFMLGTPAEVFARAEELRGVGLGVPAAQEMANTLRESGVPLAGEGLYDAARLADELAALYRADEAKRGGHVD